MKVITTVHYNRPACTQRMFNYLAYCDLVEEYEIFVFIEPGCEETLDIVNTFKSVLNLNIFTNSKLFGLWNNKKQALEYGFRLSDFVIHLEDDILLYKDALKFFEWANKKYQYDKTIFSVTAYNKLSLKEYNEIKDSNQAIERRPHYSPWAFATWKNRWLEYKDSWSGEDAELNIKYRNGRYEIYPVLSRAQNIGFENGIKSHNDIVDAYIKYWQGRGVIISQETIDSYGSWHLFTNARDSEWVKLNDNFVKTRDNDYYKEFNYLKFWAEDVNLPGKVVFTDYGTIR